MTISSLLRLIVVATATVVASTPPAPQDWVTDQAGLLSAPVRERLEARLRDYQHGSGHQVLVWTARDTSGAPIEEFSARAFAAWHVGRKGVDDGLVLFVFADGRARIEVGYGLEDRVPDAVASRLIRELIVPRLQAGDGDGAVTAGVEGLLAAVGPVSPPDAGAAGSRPEWSPGRLALWGLVLLVALILIIENPSLALKLFFYFLSARGPSGGEGRKRWVGQGGRSGGGGASG